MTLKVFRFTQDNIGFFAQLTHILLVAAYCEEQKCKPFFLVENKSLIDSQAGTNWFDYFFENNLTTSDDNETARSMILSNKYHLITSRYDINSLARGNPHSEIQNELRGLAAARRLFEKYIRIKQEFFDIAEDFMGKAGNFSDAVGVHFRGTDKPNNEADPIGFEEIFQALSKHTANTAKRIFLATDDRAFFEFLLSSPLGKRTVFFSEPAGEGHLKTNSDNFEKGKNALIDCLLLAQCRLLIKTPSQLSTYSKVFRKRLGLVLVGRPICCPYDEFTLQGDGYWPENELYKKGMISRWKNKTRFFRT